MKSGIIQVYSGNGKGKTTAAIGQAVRAVSSGLKVLFVFFNKTENRAAGKNDILKKIGITTRYFAERHPSFYPETAYQDMRKQTLDGLNYVLNSYDKGFDLIILDEILISLRDGFITEKELIELMENKPEKIELIFTGRGITKNIREKADLVTEMKDVKHPYRKGVKWRLGIEQ